MSRSFAWIMLVISAVFIFRGLNSTTAHPLMPIFWAAILAACAYKLFIKK